MTKGGFMGLLATKKTTALAVRKRNRHPNRALTEAQIRLLLSEIENIRDDALIRLGLSVGLRVSEVVGMRVSEIDFDRGLINIWDEKKDKWRWATTSSLSVLTQYNQDWVTGRGGWVNALPTQCIWS
jgi:integrase